MVYIYISGWIFQKLSVEIGQKGPHFDVKSPNFKPNRDSFSNSESWLPTESMNEFHSYSLKHIFDQLDAINFNQ